MTKLCFSLLLLTALGASLTKGYWIGVFPMFRPSSEEIILASHALLFIPPIVMALQEAAPRNDPVLSLTAFGLTSWCFGALPPLACLGFLTLLCGLMFHAAARAFRPGDRRLLLLLTLFVGVFGVHRFYAGRPLSGLYMLLLSLLGHLHLIDDLVPLIPVVLWVLSDLVFVARGRFRDGQGRRITDQQDEKRNERSSRSRRRLTLLAIFLGVVGAHRFLVRRPYTGLCMACLSLVILHLWLHTPFLKLAGNDSSWMLLSCPVLLIWLISDIIAVNCGCFSDGTGRPATA